MSKEYNCIHLSFNNSNRKHFIKSIYHYHNNSINNEEDDANTIKKNFENSKTYSFMKSKIFDEDIGRTNVIMLDNNIEYDDTLFNIKYKIINDIYINNKNSDDYDGNINNYYLFKMVTKKIDIEDLYNRLKRENGYLDKSSILSFIMNIKFVDSTIIENIKKFINKLTETDDISIKDLIDLNLDGSEFFMYEPFDINFGLNEFTVNPFLFTISSNKIDKYIHNDTNHISILSSHHILNTLPFENMYFVTHKKDVERYFETIISNTSVNKSTINKLSYIYFPFNKNIINTPYIVNNKYIDNIKYIHQKKNEYIKNNDNKKPVLEKYILEYIHFTLHDKKISISLSNLFSKITISQQTPFVYFHINNTSNNVIRLYSIDNKVQKPYLDQLKIKELMNINPKYKNSEFVLLYSIIDDYEYKIYLFVDNIYIEYNNLNIKKQLDTTTKYFILEDLVESHTSTIKKNISVLLNNLKQYIKIENKETLFISLKDITCKIKDISIYSYTTKYNKYLNVDYDKLFNTYIQVKNLSTRDIDIYYNHVHNFNYLDIVYRIINIIYNKEISLLQYGQLDNVAIKNHILDELYKNYNNINEIEYEAGMYLIHSIDKTIIEDIYNTYINNNSYDPNILHEKYNVINGIHMKLHKYYESTNKRIFKISNIFSINDLYNFNTYINTWFSFVQTKNNTKKGGAVKINDDSSSDEDDSSDDSSSDDDSDDDSDEDEEPQKLQQPQKPQESQNNDEVVESQETQETQETQNNEEPQEPQNNEEPQEPQEPQETQKLQNNDEESQKLQNVNNNTDEESQNVNNDNVNESQKLQNVNNDTDEEPQESQNNDEESQKLQNVNNNTDEEPQKLQNVNNNTDEEPQKLQNVNNNTDEESQKIQNVNNDTDEEPQESQNVNNNNDEESQKLQNVNNNTDEEPQESQNVNNNTDEESQESQNVNNDTDEEPQESQNNDTDEESQNEDNQETIDNLLKYYYTKDTNYENIKTGKRGNPVNLIQSYFDLMYNLKKDSKMNYLRSCRSTSSFEKKTNNDDL